MVAVSVVSVKPVVAAGDGLAVDVGALGGVLAGAAPALPGPFPRASRDAGRPSRPGSARIDSTTTRIVSEPAAAAGSRHCLGWRCRGAWIIVVVRRSAGRAGTFPVASDARLGPAWWQLVDGL